MQLSADGIIAELDTIFIEQFEVDPSAVVPTARLREDLDLDSLDAADMMVAIEKKFGIRMDDTEARAFRTLDDIHVYVRRLVSENNAGHPTADAHAPPAS